jgi:uncharacterized protein (TIGR03067 family)
MISFSALAMSLVCLASTLGRDTPEKSEEVGKELKRLEGTWRTVAVELGGKEMNRDDIGPHNLLVFSGNKCTLVSGPNNERKIEYTFTIDPTKKPKWMNTTRTSDKLYLLGIYELKGNTLKIFECGSGGKRPTEFKTKEGTREVIHTLQRVKL